MGLFDLFTSLTIGAICCPGDNVDAMEQAIMNDAKSENEDSTLKDEELNHELNHDKEIDNSKEA